MKGHKFWRAVAVGVSGSIALALLTFVCFRLGADHATTALLYLIVIASPHTYTDHPLRNLTMLVSGLPDMQYRPHQNPEAAQPNHEE